MKLHVAVTLDEAVKGISAYMDHHKLSAFDASLILAYMFGLDKEEMLDLIISYRSGKKIDIAKRSKFDDYWGVKK
jgi:hypothetical protein